MTCHAVESFAATQGLGVQGVVDGHAVVGRPGVLAGERVGADRWTRSWIRRGGRREAAGRTVVAVGWDGAVAGSARSSPTR